MAEMYLKCPNCGAGNPKGQKFCGSCGAMIPPPSPPPVQPTQPVYVQPMPSWIHSNMKALVAIAVVVVVVVVALSVVGMAYTQAWSKIKVIVSQGGYSTIGVDVYIDGVLKASVGIDPGSTIVGVWPVVAGTHTVQVDAGHWQVYPGYWTTITHWFSPDETVWIEGTANYYAPDGTADITYAYEVGPMYTKNVYVNL